jgi:CheY-like chemotaxis protein
MSCRIVIADDSEDDLLLFRRDLQQAPAPLALDLLATLENGKQVLEYLTGQGPYADRQKFPLPDLLVLDLKMPRMNGLEVLEWLQTHPHPGMKVVVATGSLLPADKVTALRLGADAFYTKPIDYSRLAELAVSLVRHG